MAKKLVVPLNVHPQIEVSKNRKKIFVAVNVQGFPIQYMLFTTLLCSCLWPKLAVFLYELLCGFVKMNCLACKFKNKLTLIVEESKGRGI